MLHFHRNGVQFKIPIAKDAVYDHDLLEKQIKVALNDLQALKDRSPDLEQMRHELPGRHIAMSKFGQDIIILSPETITPPTGKRRQIKEAVTVEQYVLLVELGTQPGGFAIFAPSGAGESEGGAGSVNLQLIGWTNMVSTNADPPGIIGQSTFRAGWCNQPFVGGFTDSVGVEQVKRVDQGWLAYAGDSEDSEEVTRLAAYSRLWTYEDIPYTTQWLNVEPGPPPEDICGYSWAIDPAYGGGFGSGDADYHDQLHLFYHIMIGDNKIIYWWPPEFNQKLTIRQYWHEAGAVFRNLDNYSGVLDYVESVGFPAALGELMCPNTHTKISITYEDSRRIWGILWGTNYFPVTDRGSLDQFPYKTYEDYRIKSGDIVTDFARTFCDQRGVYIYGHHTEMFITGLVRFDPGADTGTLWGLTAGRREEQIPSDRFADPTILTERELELMEGNEDLAFSWVYDGWTDLYVYERPPRWTFDLGQVMVNCGGSEFKVTDERGAGWPTVTTAFFDDYGIFTKLNTGIDENGLVDPTTIQPIYAYALSMAEYSTETGYWQGGDYGVIYGMVLDGLHYRTDEFFASGSSISIPGLEAAIDIEGAAIAPQHKVRIGVRRFHVTTVNSEEVEQ